MEKTFVSLIQKEREIVPDFKGLDSATVLKLMQQVREATKAECAEICGTLWRIDLAEKTIKELPTDRIKSK